jgi:hypothetical protein
MVAIEVPGIVAPAEAYADDPPLEVRALPVLFALLLLLIG